jgi:hypothetical protein
VVGAYASAGGLLVHNEKIYKEEASRPFLLLLTLALSDIPSSTNNTQTHKNIMTVTREVSVTDWSAVPFVFHLWRSGLSAEFLCKQAY